MPKTKLPHSIPNYLKKILKEDTAFLHAWQKVTPLAQNEWICWLENAKREDTREKRLLRTYEEIKNGKKRPCCWAGCQHR